jgi:glycogen synthase
VEPLTETTGNGFVFQAYQVAALVEGIREALAFYARPLRTRARILQRVMLVSSQRFTIARTVDQYIDLYQEILGQEVT